MIGLSFAIPAVRYLAAAAVVVLAVAYALDFTRRRRALERAGHPAQLARMTASVSHGRRVLKAMLAVTGISLTIAALARPQVEGKTSWRRRGVDLVIAVDFSKSMLARDVYPSRIERAKLEVDALLDALAGDRAAVVLFAGQAAHFPLTHDHDAARLLYEGVSPMDVAPGTDIGRALLVARCVVRPDLRNEPGCDRIAGRGGGGAPLPGQARKARALLATGRKDIDRARAIVLVTDGEDLTGNARAEAQRVIDLGIELFVVGVGSPTGELIPEVDESGKEIGWKRHPDGKSFVTTRLEEGALRELAAIAGGDDHYFRLESHRTKAEGLITRLRSLRKGDLDKRVVKIPEEVYYWLLFPAFLLLLIEACLSERRWRSS